MDIRIFRTWKWEYIPTDRIGGPPPIPHLVPIDTLQVCQGDVWADVPIVEAEKPPTPESWQPEA